MTMTRPEKDSPPLDAMTQLQPFPVGALPEPLAKFVKAGATAIGCDPSFIALPMISVCGAAIGNAARVLIKGGWIAPPIIWTCIVGDIRWRCDTMPPPQAI